MPEMDEERELIEAARKDGRRFAQLYERNFERVFAFVMRRVADRAEAERVTTLVFQHALANLAQFEWRGVPFSVWLFRIAVNIVGSHCAPADDLDRSSWPDIDRQAALFPLVAGLPPEQRAVIVKRFGEHKSIPEIALALGLSEDAIKQLQLQALEALRAGGGGSHE